MAGTAWTEVNNSFVVYDKEYTHRWVDALGPNVRKYFLVDQYHPDSCTVTAVNASTITGLESSLGGGWVFTSAAADNDGVQMQPLSECFYFGGPYPAYMGARFKIGDVDNADAFLGFSVQDTTVCAGGTYLIGFRTDDNESSVNFVIENNTAETEVEVGTLVDDTYVDVEFYYDGAGTVTYYLNNVAVGTVLTTATNFPDTEHMAPVLAMLTGAGGASVMTVQWARFIQILE